MIAKIMGPTEIARRKPNANPLKRAATIADK
jgi:hypothetical protein